LIGENHFDFDKYTSTVVAYNQKNRFNTIEQPSINPLGILVNPAFGTTTVNFATQLSLNLIDPEIGNNPVIESVTLTIPYFSTLVSTLMEIRHMN
jgi:hypothetical protein